MYIIKTDYKTRISTDLLDRVIAEGASNGDDILAAVSKIAEDTIGTLAGVIYDIAPEFAKAGVLRNHLIMVWALNIATYNIYQRIDDEEVPEKVIKNYDDTMEDLIKVSQGKFPLNLPAKPEPPADPGAGGGGGGEDVATDGNGLRRIGSAEKRSHRI